MRRKTTTLTMWMWMWTVLCVSVLLRANRDKKFFSAITVNSAHVVAKYWMIITKYRECFLKKKQKIETVIARKPPGGAESLSYHGDILEWQLGGFFYLFLSFPHSLSLFACLVTRPWQMFLTFAACLFSCSKYFFVDWYSGNFFSFFMSFVYFCWHNLLCL